MQKRTDVMQSTFWIAIIKPVHFYGGCRILWSICEAICYKRTGPGSLTPAKRKNAVCSELTNYFSDETEAAQNDIRVIDTDESLL